MSILDPDLFMDCIVHCSGLRKLEMKACSQFQECHFSIVIPKLEKAVYIDIERCSEISFNGAFWIMSESPQIAVINFEPKGCNCRSQILGTFIQTF